VDYVEGFFVLGFKKDIQRWKRANEKSKRTRYCMQALVKLKYKIKTHRRVESKK
jgi:hypothetical protein